MELRALGPSDLQVSVVGLGCNNFGGRIDRERSREVVHRALDLGITLFDTADVYGRRGGSEEILGDLLRGERDRVVLATKFGLPMSDDGRHEGASARYIVQAVEASLKRLGTDRIDLYQLHRPDPRTPIEETLRALDELVRRGLVRFIGCSNLPAWQVVEAEWTARTLDLARFVSCQDEYSLLARGVERELLPAMERYGLGLLPYFPLASGLLTGKYRRDLPLPEGARLTNAPALADQVLNDENWDVVEALEAFALRRQYALLDVAFAWLAGRPRVSSVIAGATSAAQVEQNVAAVRLRLTEEDLAEIDGLTRRA